MATHSNKYKTVLMPIKVPDGTFCFDRWATCGYFDNEGGHPRCMLGFFPLDYNGHGDVPKHEKCRKLMRVEKFKRS
jgi:hypothetical protein